MLGYDFCLGAKYCIWHVKILLQMCWHLENLFKVSDTTYDYKLLASCNCARLGGNNGCFKSGFFVKKKRAFNIKNQQQQRRGHITTNLKKAIKIVLDVTSILVARSV